MAGFGLKGFLRIQHNCHRPVVHQLDLHHLLKATGLAAQPGSAQLINKVFIEQASLLGTGCGIEGRALAAAHVTEQSELRDDKHRPAHFTHSAVHVPGFVVEDAQPGNLLSEVIGSGFRVVLPDTQEHQQASADFPDGLARDGHTGPQDTLHHGAHIWIVTTRKQRSRGIQSGALQGFAPTITLIALLDYFRPARQNPAAGTQIAEVGLAMADVKAKINAGEKIKQIISEQLGVDEAEVTPTASFVDDLGADSLDTVELVMAFEEAFDIEIPDEDAEKIRTVQDAISYVEQKVA